jgi:hypothetical protein
MLSGTKLALQCVKPVQGLYSCHAPCCLHIIISNYTGNIATAMYGPGKKIIFLQNLGEMRSLSLQVRKRHN